MIYQLTESGFIKRSMADGAALFLPPDNNGTPAWAEYQDWLAQGNTPAPAPPLTPPGPDYLAFWDALMASTLYASIRQQSFVSLPMNTLATEFIALIGDAKAGRPNEAAIQASMQAILSTGSFAPEQLNELQAALEAGGLQEIYTFAP